MAYVAMAFMMSMAGYDSFYTICYACVESSEKKSSYERNDIEFTHKIDISVNYGMHRLKSAQLWCILLFTNNSIIRRVKSALSYKFHRFLVHKEDKNLISRRRETAEKQFCRVD